MSERNIVRVRDVMKAEFDMVDGMATVSEALTAMRRLQTKCLMVDKRHPDDEFGMLLVSDIARHVLGRDRSPERVNVYEVMAKPVISVDPDMDIRFCARLFERFQLTRAPVVESGKIIGIVSFTDMVLRGMCTDSE
ncbi:CBS domain-containing protein [Thiohalomonas denitrificans]|uniref:CBS domain-containing protein n=1 Tax=Thiohalomonas denitrificans TaxID=415747 RepID=A0A1G5Q7Y0_9GAMM|nr:CBS domain-containing protein [Thiohalomonas denitrificans]SCZ57389.1 CBS domain-containing protein [Thiohalomonas denitrificans]